MVNPPAPYLRFRAYWTKVQYNPLPNFAKNQCESNARSVAAGNQRIGKFLRSMSCKRGKRALDVVLPDVQVSETHKRYFELTN